jgi:hypothetical protein
MPSLDDGTFDCLANSKVLKVAIMPPDPALQLNRSVCQADFSYSMTSDLIKIIDLNLGNKSVTNETSFYSLPTYGGLKENKIPAQYSGTE